MHLQRFNDELDVFNDWLTVHGKLPTDYYDLPEVGFVAYEEDFPVAMAFLRQVEGNFAILDNLTTNPKASSELRSKAIDAVVTQIIWQAKEMNLNSLMAWSIEPGILARSKKFGFEKPIAEFIVLNLTYEE